MELIILPGNSTKNREWAQDIAEKLKDVFARVYVHEYAHWDQEGSRLDFERERQRVKAAVAGRVSYAVFAKSAGALLSLDMIDQEELSPQWCIYVGSAIRMGRRLRFDLDSWLSSHRVPTLWVQKEFDPAMSYDDLRATVEDLSHGTNEFVQLPGSDHAYLETDELAMRVEEFAVRNR
ncbi:MAG: hypothetical protein PHG63_03195 [Candidatus Dojkabacteria bacterium]|nr:hypothetical protein [Candidatus Dojkabacteria bacterium]